MSTLSRHVSAPRGATITCKGWPQEAALRMLMNNLDPDVAERPDDLVVYGGSGRAARSWAAFDAIVATLRRLEHDETLVVQSGKPVAVFRTHPWAPRVLIANALLVPAWATWERFRDLEDRGLTMYGQMTAGSWIYIGTQGILQGTYETLAELARRHFGGSLAGRLVVTAGLGGMGGAQPLAVTMNGGDRARRRGRPAPDRAPPRDALRRRARPTIWTRRSTRVERWQQDGVGPIPGARGQRRRRAARARAPRRDARRRDRPDLGARCAQRLRPERPDARARPRRCGATNPSRVHARGRSPPWPSTSGRCSRSSATARSSFDYGNNIRAQAQQARRRRRVRHSRLRARVHPPALLPGQGAVPVGGALGRSGRHRGDRPARARDVHRRRARSAAGSAWRASASRFRDCRRGSSGSATATARASGSRSTIWSGAAWSRRRSSSAAITSTPGSVASPNRETEGDARRQRRDRRLAGAERAAQHRVRRHLGVGASWRRRRDRLLSPRGHGRRGRRHARGGREAAARADLRSRARGRAPRGRGLPGRNRHGAPQRHRHAMSAGGTAQ